MKNKMNILKSKFKGEENLLKTVINPTKNVISGGLVTLINRNLEKNFLKHKTKLDKKKADIL